jgi:hypothetical protein
MKSTLHIVLILFLDVTVLLSLTFFLNMVAETMPPTSERPLIGKHTLSQTMEAERCFNLTTNIVQTNSFALWTVCHSSCTVLLKSYSRGAEAAHTYSGNKVNVSIHWTEFQSYILSLFTLLQLCDPLRLTPIVPAFLTTHWYIPNIRCCLQDDDASIFVHC